MSELLTDDILQIISQYSPSVYCTLRLVSKEVKEIVDQVLPMGVRSEDSGRAVWNDWRVKFLRIADWCGFRLMDRRDFDDWINAMIVDCGTKEKYGDRVEKFCRDYLSLDEKLKMNELQILCVCNRKEYVRELWNKAKDKYGRFHSECIHQICMLEDLEFVKLVYEYFHDSITVDVVRMAIQKAILCQRWRNVIFLIEKHPCLKQDDVLQSNHVFVEATIHWDLFVKVGSFPNDKEKVIEAVKQNAQLIMFADESFRKDKDVLMEAVKQNGWILDCAHESLQNDRDLALEAIKQNRFELEFANETLRNDREIVMAAVKRNGSALEFTNESLRKDREIVMAAVKQDGSALGFADESLRNDKEIVMAASNQHLFNAFPDESILS